MSVESSKQVFAGTEPEDDILPCGVDIEETCRLALPFIEDQVDACLILDRDDSADAQFFQWLAQATLAEKVKDYLPQYFGIENPKLDEENVFHRDFWQAVIELSNAVESGDFSEIVAGVTDVSPSVPVASKHPVVKVHYFLDIIFTYVKSWRTALCECL